MQWLASQSAAVAWTHIHALKNFMHFFRGQRALIRVCGGRGRVDYDRDAA